jgi:hypothetical protein
VQGFVTPVKNQLRSLPCLPSLLLPPPKKSTTVLAYAFVLPPQIVKPAMRSPPLLPSRANT